MIPYSLGGTVTMIDSETSGLSRPVIDLLKRGLPSRMADIVNPRKLLSRVLTPNRSSSRRDVSSSPESVLKRIVSFIENEIKNNDAEDKQENLKLDFQERKENIGSVVELGKATHIAARRSETGTRSFESVIDKLLDHLKGPEYRSELTNLKERHRQNSKIQNDSKRFQNVVDRIMDLISTYEKEKQSNKGGIPTTETPRIPDNLSQYIEELLKIGESHDESTADQTKAKPGPKTSKSTIVYVTKGNENVSGLSSRSNLRSPSQSSFRIFVNGQRIQPKQTLPSNQFMRRTNEEDPFDFMDILSSLNSKISSEEQEKEEANKPNKQSKENQPPMVKSLFIFNL